MFSIKLKCETSQIILVHQQEHVSALEVCQRINDAAQLAYDVLGQTVTTQEMLTVMVSDLTRYKVDDHYEYDVRAVAEGIVYTVELPIAITRNPLIEKSELQVPRPGLSGWQPYRPEEWVIMPTM